LSQLPQVTIKEIIEKSASYLKGRDFVDSPRLEAEMLLSHVLDLKRMELYLSYDRPLLESELAKMRSMLKWRAAGYPMAYILGSRGFFKSDFFVTPDTLIPRPETECLVEKAIELAPLFSGEQIQICDFGAGTGAIGLSVALELRNSQVTLIEKCPRACKVARRNVNNLGLQNRAQVINLDVTQDLCLSQAYDIILANPPYISPNDNRVEHWVKAFEPGLALFADNEGLSEIKNWIQAASKNIKQGGFIIFEHGDQQGKIVMKIMNDNGFHGMNAIFDLSKKWRHTVAFKA